MGLVNSSSNNQVFAVLFIHTYVNSSQTFFFISNIEPLGNRFTKVNRLSSESLFAFQNDLHVHMLLYKNGIKV